MGGDEAADSLSGAGRSNAEEASNILVVNAQSCLQVANARLEGPIEALGCGQDSLIILLVLAESFLKHPGAGGGGIAVRVAATRKVASSFSQIAETFTEGTGRLYRSGNSTDQGGGRVEDLSVGERLIGCLGE